MDLRILQLIEGAREAKGLAVIIDVFRAFSTACYVFGNGARCIVPVGNLDVAYELKRKNPSFLFARVSPWCTGSPGIFSMHSCASLADMSNFLATSSNR